MVEKEILLSGSDLKWLFIKICFTHNECIRSDSCHLHIRTCQTNLHPFWCQSLRLRWSSLNIETFSSHTDGEGIVLTAQPTTTETFIEETVCQY